MKLLNGLLLGMASAALLLAGCEEAPVEGPKTSTQGLNKQSTPIILTHGLAGWPFDKSLKPHLEGLGYTVFMPTVSPFGPIKYRAEELRGKIDTFLDSVGAESGIIIAHSMGGPDARWLLCEAGLSYDRIDAVLTIASPHRGTAIADFVVDNVPSLLQFGVNSLLKKLGLTPRSAPDLQAMKDLSSRGMAEFNRTCFDRPDVEYYSYSSSQSPSQGLNPAMYASYYIIKDADGANDGIAAVSSARWGHYLGNLNADHGDHIGGALGVPTRFDFRGLYAGAIEAVYTNHNNGTYRSTHSDGFESRHPYASNLNAERVVTMPGAAELQLTFDPLTEVESDYDFIEISDAQGIEIEGSPFTGKSLAGNTYSVPGDTVRIRTRSDYSVQTWGYRVSQIKAVRFPSSAHAYSNNLSETQRHSIPGARNLEVSFSPKTETESGYDFIRITDATGAPVTGSPFTGRQLAGKTIVVNGDTVDIQLVTDYSVTRWGYAVTNVVEW